MEIGVKYNKMSKCQMTVMETVSFSRKYKLLRYFDQVSFICVHSFLQVCSWVIPMGANLYLKSSAYSMALTQQNY